MIQQSLHSKGINRREALRNLTGGALGLGVLSTTQLLAEETPAADSLSRRLAIIGSGIGGIATAYFADARYKIDLFEAAEKLGGHADTIVVEDDGTSYSVDIGAEFFHPETHPLYWSLLAEIGALASLDDKNDVVVNKPANLSIFDAATRSSLFTSSHPFDNLGHALNFAKFAGIGRVAPDTMSWDLTLGEWIDQLAIDKTYKDTILAPWIASVATGNIPQAMGFSARAVLMAFARTFPANMMATAYTYNSSIGLEGILHLLLGRCKNVTAHVKSAVTKIESFEGQWFVTTDAGREGPFEAVVVNASPYHSKKFLADLDKALFDILDRFEFYPTTMVVHRDPIYMPADPAYWCSQNAAVDGENCEGSVWMGSTLKAPLNIFKSWANHRAEQPKDLILKREFFHTGLTPATMKAVRDLNAYQAPKGLYFAGHYTAGADLQETALYSALVAAKALAADSPALASFMKRLVDEKKDAIAYAVN